MTLDPLSALFCPRSVAFVGGAGMAAILRYHREQGFAGRSWVVNPKYSTLEGIECVASVEALPEAPDLAFVSVNRDAATPVIAALRDRGCRAVICHAGGFAETGADGRARQAAFEAAVGDMVALGPNAAGVANFLDPFAAILDHMGVAHVSSGVAILSQGGGFLCDAVFADRSLAISHLVGCGNQSVTTVAECAEYLLDDPRVSAIGLSFEGLPETASLRRAAMKAQQLGKPIIAIKFGTTAAGAHVVASHTASMAGQGAGWEALFARLGIISTASEEEFFETLKLADEGALPRGRRVLVTSVSGVMGVMLADHLSEAGFELPQPSDGTAARLRALLPAIATPCNPQDVTMAAWNDAPRQRAIYETLLDEGVDIALMVQNFPRPGMWDISEYAAQTQAMGEAAAGRGLTAVQLAPLAECFPAEQRTHTQQMGLVPMQGLQACVAALGHGVWWHEWRAAVVAQAMDLTRVPPPPGPPDEALDEAQSKAVLRDHGIPVPRFAVC
ncbi:MAG: CoA-binding protein, partial [Pseudomonadota bacterium]